VVGGINHRSPLWRGDSSPLGREAAPEYPTS